MYIHTCTVWACKLSISMHDGVDCNMETAFMTVLQWITSMSADDADSTYGN